MKLIYNVFFFYKQKKQALMLDRSRSEFLHQPKDVTHRVTRHPARRQNGELNQVCKDVNLSLPFLPNARHPFDKKKL